MTYEPLERAESILDEYGDTGENEADAPAIITDLLVAVVANEAELAALLDQVQEAALDRMKGAA